MTDVLIIGAGPAGSTSAAFLVQRGFDVLVLEKQRFPRFSIGESLLPQSMQMIEKAGMKEAVLSAGFQYKNGASFVYSGKHYEFNFAMKSTPGYEWIFEVPRADFDHLLINEAERMGAKVRYEVEIIKAEFPDGKPVITAKTKDGKTEVHKPKFVFDASGFGRVLPKLLDLETPSTQPPRYAWFTQVYDNIAPGAFDRQKIRVTIHPKHRDIWYWLIPFSNGKSSMGVVGPEELLKSYQGTNEERLWALHREDPMLGDLLKNAKPAMPVDSARSALFASRSGRPMRAFATLLSHAPNVTNAFLFATDVPGFANRPEVTSAKSWSTAPVSSRASSTTLRARTRKVYWPGVGLAMKTPSTLLTLSWPGALATDWPWSNWLPR